MTKKIVHYNPEETVRIAVGGSAVIFPIDHPDSGYVSNTMLAVTSTVLWYDESTGEFETLNTIYKPQL
jgi:hypothetical protein